MEFFFIVLSRIMFSLMIFSLMIFGLTIFSLIIFRLEYSLLGLFLTGIQQASGTFISHFHNFVGFDCIFVGQII